MPMFFSMLAGIIPLSLRNGGIWYCLPPLSAGGQLPPGSAAYVSQYENVKPLWVLLQQQMMDEAVYVSTRTVGRAKFQSDYHHSIPTPSFNHRSDALPVTQPTVSHQAASTLGLRLNIRKQDMKWRLADLVLTNQQSAQLRSISVPYIWAFWRENNNAEIMYCEFVLQ